MSNFRASVAEIEMKKQTLEDIIASKIRLFESETGLLVRRVSVDRFPRGLKKRNPVFRVEATVQFWGKHNMEDLAIDSQLRRIERKNQLESKRKERENG